jgi:hypothetical protein
MPGDVLSGRYPLTDDAWKLLGQPVNASQANIPARTNLRAFGLGLTDEVAALVSGKATVVAVPVEVGDVISKVTFLTGNTAGSTLTHQWAAIYSGVLTTAALEGAQSTDITAATVSASTAITLSLGTSVLVTNAIAPYGYVYAAISFTGTVPSLASAVCAAVCQYAWFTDTPLAFGGTYSSALGATAPSTITLASVSATAAVAAVFLT